MNYYYYYYYLAKGFHKGITKLLKVFVPSRWARLCLIVNVKWFLCFLTARSHGQVPEYCIFQPGKSLLFVWYSLLSIIRRVPPVFQRHWQAIPLQVSISVQWTLANYCRVLRITTKSVVSSRMSKLSQLYKRARFSKAPETFRARKAIAISRTRLTITELFYSHILNMKRSSQAYTLLRF